jgi:uncharacterized protein YndB with AHSA1/START domain
MSDDLGDLEFRRTYRAPRETVFAALTTPEHLTNFWGPPGITTPLANIELDPRVGGVFNATMVNDATGEEYPNNGFFIAFDAPNLIAFSETGAADGMTTSINFVDLGDGRCETICTQTNVPAMYRSPEAQAGMNAALDRGVTYIESLRSKGVHDDHMDS